MFEFRIRLIIVFCVFACCALLFYTIFTFPVDSKIADKIVF